MYSESDLQSAVAAGVISKDAADALRQHVTGNQLTSQQTPMADEENFRLLTGFNDIFVTIAAIISLIAVGGIGNAINDSLTGFFVAAAAWGLAEFFTRKRRMALPSIILLLAFVGGIAASLAAISGHALGDDIGDRTGALIAAGVGIITAGAAYAHWRRFKVPITIAAGAAAIAATAVALIMAIAHPAESETTGLLMTLTLVGGLVMFAFAMRWDMSDRARQTRRSDVAFWLHLLAAPMIAHPIFWLLGVTSGEGNTGAAFGVLGVYLIMAIVAIAVDRRALLVSALAYVLFALTLLFRKFGVVELNVAITSLIIGSALLSLSAFWAPIRRAIVTRLPADLQARLPLTHLAAA